MRSFFYRLSWDKQFKKRTLIALSSSLCALCLIALAVPGILYLVNNTLHNDTENVEEENLGTSYFLQFNDQQNNEEEQSEDAPDNNASNNTESTSTSNLNTKTSSSSNTNTNTSSEQTYTEQQTHVHQWHKVIDSAAWTEYKEVNIGTQYLCLNCGFSTTSSSAITNHCSSFSHTFTQSPITETQSIYHPEVSHLECSCGVRRK